MTNYKNLKNLEERLSFPLLYYFLDNLGRYIAHIACPLTPLEVLTLYSFVRLSMGVYIGDF